MEQEQPTFPDRDVQLEILKRLKQGFPKQVDVNGWRKEFPYLDHEIHYLHQHGLLVGLFSAELGGNKRASAATLTARGIDFLANDGGLGAILGTVVVKLHADTIKTLLESKINESNLPPEEKRRFRDWLRELPAESTTRLVTTLVEEGVKAGLSRGPQVGQWLQTVFHSL
jgi:hypothetical protein